jgi:hypothetical protein
MKYRLISLFAISITALIGREIDTPANAGPKLTASDISWIHGIHYVKGRLPNEEPVKLRTVKLILEYEKGKIETLVEPITIKYYEGDLEHWKEVVGELLVSVRIVDGKHEFFLGYTTSEQSVFMRKEIKMRGIGLPAITHRFQGRTGPMADDLKFVVPSGESELFVFVKDGEPYARAKLISEPVDSGQ